MKPGPKVSTFLKSKPFVRAFKKLPQPIQEDFKRLVKEMVNGEYLPSRDLKQRKGAKKNQPKEWQARLSISHRVTFHLKDGEAKLLLIGEHKLFD